MMKFASQRDGLMHTRSSLRLFLGLLTCLFAWPADAAQPGDIVEVNGYGDWDTVGKVLRVDGSGILVLYREKDGIYNTSVGFSRYFAVKDVRPFGPQPAAGDESSDSTGAAAPLPTDDDQQQPAGAAAFSVGDRVQGWNIAWYDGTVVEVGTGANAGSYLNKHDKFAQNSYYAEASVRRQGAASLSVASDARATADGPRTGTYGCGVYLSGRYTPTQTISLDGSRYTTDHGDGGGYTYDAASQRLEFGSGALANQVGQFEAGKHTIIRLTQRADLDESSYTQKWRSQVCSPR